MLLAPAAVGQDPVANAEPTEVRDHKAFFERCLMATDPKMPPGALRVGEIVRAPGKDFVDQEVKLGLVRRDGALPVDGTLLHALVHNIEGTSIWRLRRARFARVASKDSPWKVEEIVFGFRKGTDKDDAATQPLPKATPALAQFLRSMVRKTPKQATYRTIELNMTAKQPLLTASVEFVGKDYKQRFFALEKSLLDQCKKPKSAFVDVLWGGGEEPIETDGKAIEDGVSGGATFTLELRIRKQ